MCLCNSCTATSPSLEASILCDSLEKIAFCIITYFINNYFDVNDIPVKKTAVGLLLSLFTTSYPSMEVYCAKFCACQLFSKFIKIFMVIALKVSLLRTAQITFITKSTNPLCFSVVN